MLSISEQVILGTYRQTNPDIKEYFRFKTPKKIMVLNEYEKHLSDNLFDKFHNLNTKEDLKKLYCLDEIYSELNPNRKEKIDFSRDISSVINFSIRLYANQPLAQKMRNEIGKFEDIVSKINHSKISFDQIKYLESRAETITKYVLGGSPDFEIKERIQESKEIIREANKKIRGGIDKRLTREFKENLGYFECLNKKDFLSDAEFLNLKTRKSPLSELENILNHFGDSRVNDVSDALKKYTLLISSHDYFCNNKEEFDLVMNKQKKLNRKIKGIKLKDGHYLFEFIRRNRIRKYLIKTEKNFANLAVFYDNRYLRQKFDDEKEELVQVFRSLEPGKNWPEKLLKQYEIFSKKNERITNLLNNIQERGQEKEQRTQQGGELRRCHIKNQKMLRHFETLAQKKQMELQKQQMTATKGVKGAKQKVGVLQAELEEITRRIQRYQN
ncbi:hypothetical protein ES703_83987 [subsurface metagenome]